MAARATLTVVSGHLHRTVVLGSLTYGLRGGRPAVVGVHLNRAAVTLLKAHRSGVHVHLVAVEPDQAGQVPPRRRPR